MRLNIYMIVRMKEYRPTLLTFFFKLIIILTAAIISMLWIAFCIFIYKD